MEPWDRMVESRTVPDARMVMGREEWALVSRRRVMFITEGVFFFFGIGRQGEGGG